MTEMPAAPAEPRYVPGCADWPLDWAVDRESFACACMGPCREPGWPQDLCSCAARNAHCEYLKVLAGIFARQLTDLIDQRTGR